MLFITCLITTHSYQFVLLYAHVTLISYHYIRVPAVHCAQATPAVKGSINHNNLRRSQPACHCPPLHKIGGLIALSSKGLSQSVVIIHGKDYMTHCNHDQNEASQLCHLSHEHIKQMSVL